MNWHTDVQIAFRWVREALLRPLRTRKRGDRDQQAAPRVAGLPAHRRIRRRQSHPAIITAYAQEEATAPVSASCSPRCCRGSRR